ncbi:hypothetical protein JJL45_00375 [Tamlana sp. s12]|uniref:hypothetical protein n=1 Tax=Tamlana sp. s12 TaxID=1630406 RepID=UPI0007FDDF75|nr:hypothetical protein [Tamlana sp. s12]OBQ57322.1 hypothetical protein VQ01_02290 [Tamlana sp. s12]QQY82482.1 hypothetical protein JJL45_00375 [Tamlana sp. s12]
MKKSFFKYFIFLFALLLVGQSTSFAEVRQQEASASTSKTFSKESQLFSKSHSSTHLLDIKVDEIEIEEYKNSLRKKTSLQYDFTTWFEAFIAFITFEKGTPLFSNILPLKVSNKRYILFQVYRL